MQENKAKNKKIIFSKNQGGKIAALILAVILLVVVIVGATFAFGNPSPKAALTSAAGTNIKTARVDVKTTNSKGKMYSNYVVGPNNTIHITMKSVPKSDTNSELWSNNQYVYHRDNKEPWNYIKQNDVFNEVYSGYKKLYTAHNFKEFSDDAFKQLQLKSNGLDGYVISYNGNNKDVIKSLQKTTSVTPISDPRSSNVKNIELQVKVNRQKQLTEFYYKVTYFSKKEGTLSLHLYDINQVKKLKIPTSVTKNAKKLNIKTN